jgi:methionyl-tRNA formyltransferase
MSNAANPESQTGISVVFFGRRCPFTAIPFERLARAGINLRALFLSTRAPIGEAVKPRRYRPSLSIGAANASVERVAGERSIPVYDVRRPLGRELEAVVRQHEPDLLVAVCFPWRIPQPIRATARLGSVNLHPSPLPRFRGPDPLFWAYRHGETAWGVTVHQICDSFDSGSIVAQSLFAIPDELPGDQLDRHTAERGAELLARVAAQAQDGTLHGSAQNDAEATYQTWPTAEELLIDPTWGVQRVINFVVGVRPLGYEPALNTTRGLRFVRSARRTEQDMNFSESWLDEQTVRLRFSDGVVEFTLA